MGCRGTIEIWEHGAAPKDKESPVVLYTHWEADKMFNNLKRALSKHDRWRQPDYLSRIIFSEMIKDDINGTTGFGIRTDNVCDASIEIVVDCDRQEVIVKSMKHSSFNKTYTFSELVEQYAEVNHNPPNCS